MQWYADCIDNISKFNLIIDYKFTYVLTYSFDRVKKEVELLRWHKISM
jgi:hypothetical protein